MTLGFSSIARFGGRSSVWVQRVLRRRQRHPYALPSHIDAFHATSEHVERIAPESSRPEEYCELPDNLCVSPGTYVLAGQVWNMTAPGVYRFSAEGMNLRQVLVPTKDPRVNCELTQWLHGYGSTDHRHNTDKCIELAKTRRIWLTCTGAAHLAVAILRMCGHSARVVMGLTMDEWNTYNNGHTLIEVKTDDGWIRFDPTIGGWPQINGLPVSLLQLTREQEKSFRLSFVHTCLARSFGKVQYRSEPGEFWLEQALLNDDLYIDWYQRVMQLPGILSEGYFHFPISDSLTRTRMLSYSTTFRSQTLSKFEGFFYGD